jgi:hypothetical protein
MCTGCNYINSPVLSVFGQDLPPFSLKEGGFSFLAHCRTFKVLGSIFFICLCFSKSLTAVSEDLTKHSTQNVPFLQICNP